ncbi:DNA alkylation repair protein [Agromyces sp. CFH 90414]|uniref:DNA alkylation repair protein n=1 Tax=Agromyces agglutinans TaxID=2662258 RepID=A0A6I2F2R2_9MICO|nr:DNA alkylation repair protein [Agromyces agglutinans]MRG58819.1 DNA alkylation repair protein [Agromyces agglutinans]
MTGAVPGRGGAESTLADVQAELRALEDPKTREANERRGDPHGVNLAQLRALAKRVKTNHELALDLWATGDLASRLLAILICRPKSFGPDELDAMMREERSPKGHDWLVNYVVKQSRHAEDLRLAWLDDDDPLVVSAAWALNAERIRKTPETLDLPALLDTIEAEMRAAAAPVQWEMNTSLAMIGIHHPAYRARSLEIGERLEVLKDYPTPPGCTSPYAPAWIGEMVRRQEAGSSR